MFKLLCMDMDGTLLNSEGKISRENIEAVKAAHERGVKVTVCTGRLFTSADYYADLLGVKVPVIASNGAYIREKDKNKIIYKSILGREKCIKILSVLEKYNINPHFNSDDTVFTGRIIHASAGYTKLNKTLPANRQVKVEEVKDWYDTFSKYEEEILKCICIDDDLQKVLSAKEELLKHDDIEVVSSHFNNFEVMCEGVSKGRAVEILAGIYGINKEEIICIGDNENDLSMIKYAGMGIAMGNAENYIIEQADYTTDTNDNNGVAKAIEKFILV